MALLYLVDDGVAVDEQGSEWTLAGDGTWEPGGTCAAEKVRETPRLTLVSGGYEEGAGSRGAPAPTRAGVTLRLARLTV
jgi:hypothetical protein